MDKNNKIENLLALLLINTLKDSTLEDKAGILNMAGFSHSEIADFLCTTPAVIKQSVYMAKKKQKNIKLKK